MKSCAVVTYAELEVGPAFRIQVVWALGPA